MAKFTRGFTGRGRAEREPRLDMGRDPRVAAATVYVCGSARFADAASRLLVDAGVAVERIRVEGFGPTG
jgi:ferredoxin-NADP reductase